jgi:hypothetical protein
MSRRMQWIGQSRPLVAAVAAVLVLIAIAARAPRVAAAGWLIAFVTISAVPLGSLAWLMIHRLTGGHWGDCLRLTFAGAATVAPLLVVAFVPVLVALPLLYPWVGAPGAIKPDVASFYLNVPFFLLRAAIGFAGWSVLAAILPAGGGRAGLMTAAIGLIFYALMASLLSTDWIVSVEPSFISTSFGASIAIAQLLGALAFAALFAPPLDDGATRDLAGLMLAVCLGVTYINFMAVLVMWYGDLPDRVFWFAERVRQPWLLLAIGAFTFGALCPVFSLLFARVRASRVALRFVAASILVGLAFYDAWLLAPAFGAGALGAAAIAALASACIFVTLVRSGWPARLLARARFAP